MRGTMKAGVLLSLMLLLALAGPVLASGGTAARPNTGINTDAPFPVGVDPICGIKITVYGSEPMNVYNGARMPAAWLPPIIVESPAGSGDWTITFGNTGPAACISRSDPRWWECGLFKGVHFGFYTNDSIVNYLNQDPNVWSPFGPPCVYFGPDGETVPCTGLSSHAIQGFGQIAILNATASTSAGASAARVRVKTGLKAGAQGLKISNVRIAVVPDAVAINDLGPCALKDLAWQNVSLADSVLPPSTPEGGVGTLNVPIPDNILAQKGWAVMAYDVTDPATGNVLTSSTLDFPLN
jgi:hypothetical protein